MMSIINCISEDVWINDVPFNTVDENGCHWIITEIDGWWGLPDPEVPSDPRPFAQDGNYLTRGRYGPRVITLEGIITPGRDPESVVHARNKLNRTIDAVREVATLRVNEDPPKQANVQIIGRPLTKFDKLSGELTFSIQFRAVDPRKYSVVKTDVSTSLPAATQMGRTYPKFFNYTYGAPASTGELHIENEGSYPTNAVLRIHGPVSNPTITHANTGSVLTFDITLSAGEFLDINLQDKTVLLNGVETRRRALHPSSSWFTLAAGSNIIRYTGRQYPPPQDYSPLRKNIARNPDMYVNTTGWSFSAGTGGAASAVRTGGATPSPGVYRVTWTTSATAVGGHVSYIATAGDILPETPYRTSIDVKSNVTRDVRLALQWYNGSTVVGSTVTSQIHRLTRGITKTLSLAGLAHGSANRVAVRIIPETTVVQSGTAIEVSNLLLEAVDFDKVKLRGNFIANPKPASTSNWVAESGNLITLDSGGGVRAQQTTTGASLGLTSTSDIPVIAGDILHVLMDVKTSHTALIQPVAILNGTTDLSDGVGQKVQTSANNWDTYELTITVPSSGNVRIGARALSVPGGTDVPSGAFLYVRRALAEIGTTGPYFDGDSSSTLPGVSSWWLTAIDSSMSVELTVDPSELRPYFDGTYPGASWDGAVGQSMSTRQEVPLIPATMIYLSYQSAWIE